MSLYKMLIHKQREIEELQGHLSVISSKITKGSLLTFKRGNMKKPQAGEVIFVTTRGKDVDFKIRNIETKKEYWVSLYYVLDIHVK